MIYKIARKEFTEMWRDGRFRWTALIVFALLLTALSLGWKNYNAPESAQIRVNFNSV